MDPNVAAAAAIGDTKALVEHLNEVTPPTLTSTFVEQPARLSSHRSTRLQVLSFLQSSPGREAVLRLIQYGLRLAIFLRRRRFTKPTLINLLSVVSLLAAFRRVVTLLELAQDGWWLARSWRWTEGKGKEKAKEEHQKTEEWVDLTIVFSRQALDLVATVAGGIYLFGRHSLLKPVISPEKSPLADWLADMSTLTSSLLGLVLVSRARKAIWKEGRGVRRGLVDVEEKLDRQKFWEESERAEEKRLRDRVRSGRRVLKALRDELNALWWERGRLISDTLFAAYNVLEVQTGSEGVKSATGIVSAVITLSQSWNEHKYQ